MKSILLLFPNRDLLLAAKDKILTKYAGKIEKYSDMSVVLRKDVLDKDVVAVDLCVINMAKTLLGPAMGRDAVQAEPFIQVLKEMILTLETYRGSFKDVLSDESPEPVSAPPDSLPSSDSAPEEKDEGLGDQNAN